MLFFLQIFNIQMSIAESRNVVVVYTLQYLLPNAPMGRIKEKFSLISRAQLTEKFPGPRWHMYKMSSILTQSENLCPLLLFSLFMSPLSGYVLEPCSCLIYVITLCRDSEEI
jgi:hypothetical protein